MDPYGLIPELILVHSLGRRSKENLETANHVSCAHVEIKYSFYLISIKTLRKTS